MSLYSPTEKASLCKIILRATHALLAASLELCKSDWPVLKDADIETGGLDRGRERRDEGAAWVCFIVEQTPMVSFVHVLVL